MSTTLQMGDTDAAPTAQPLAGPLTSGRMSPVLLPVALLVVLLAMWELISAHAVVSRLILASPSQIAVALSTAGPEIVGNMLVTLAQAVVGFVTGNVAGLMVAILFVHSDLARRTIYPVAIAAEAVPIVAVVPVLILWLGNGMEPKIFITAFLTFFPMLVNAFRGLRSADGEVKELLYTLSASPLQTLFIVRLPAAVPFLLNALKLSACTCVVASIVAEWLASDRGLGFLIVLYGTRYQIPEVWATALVATAMSLALYGAVVLVEKAATPWRRHLPT